MILRNPKIAGLFLALFVSTSFLNLTGCATMGPKRAQERHVWEYKKKHFNLYSLKDDIRLGELVMKAQIKEFKKKGVGVDLPKHRALKRRIERIVRRIAAVSDKPNLPYEVHIFDRPDIANAFVLPGGKIGVFTGLFDREKGLVNKNSDAEIAAVIGHEMSHATLRHITRRITTLQGVGFLGSIATIGIYHGVGPDATYMFRQIFSLGANLYFPSYTRKHEGEADQVGFYYMARAGYDPIAAVTIWKRAAVKKGKKADRTSFFASHPASGVRAKTLEVWLPEAQNIYRGKLRK